MGFFGRGAWGGFEGCLAETWFAPRAIFLWLVGGWLGGGGGVVDYWNGKEDFVFGSWE